MPQINKPLIPRRPMNVPGAPGRTVVTGQVQPGVYRNQQNQVYRSNTGMIPRKPQISTGVKEAPPRGGFQVGVGRGMGNNQGLEVLAGQAANLQRRIHDQGGRSNAPVAAQRLKQVNRAIRGMNNPGGSTRDVGSMRNGGAQPPQQLPDDSGGMAPPGDAWNGGSPIQPGNGPQGGGPPLGTNPEEAWNGGSPISEDSDGVGPRPGDDGGFRGIRDFAQTDFTQDPVYQNALKMGNQDLNRRLSAQGLSGSGAELESAALLNSQLSGQLGDKYLSLARDDAGRYDAQNENESARRERREDAQWGRYRDFTDLMTRQSPMSEAYQGTGQVSGLTGKLGDAQANNRRDRYKRVQARGGGGGQPIPAYRPPYPSQPYLGDIMLGRELGQGAGQQSWMNNLIDFGGNLLGSFL